MIKLLIHFLAYAALGGVMASADLFWYEWQFWAVIVITGIIYLNVALRKNDNNTYY